MYTTTVKIDGMMCGHCEAHVNDAFRAKLDVQSVKSSHTRGETAIVAEKPFTLEEVAAALEGTGYRALEAESVEKAAKKGIFDRFK